ncbi:MAG: ORF6N domain-containing protein, partial [Epsilonproteobacteria bacterium]|nr:ORF6N domain-containing protein [Campylobacterota bacterium]
MKFGTLESKLINYNNQMVLIDSDVAELYGVETKRVNEAIKNNLDKFPKGYILELSKEEKNKVVENFDHLSKLKYSLHNTKLNQILEDDEDGEIIETTTKYEFNLGFAKVSRSVKKIK